jgi:hypothetical protein
MVDVGGRVVSGDRRGRALVAGWQAPSGLQRIRDGHTAVGVPSNHRRGGDRVIEPNMAIDMLLPTVDKQGGGGPRLTDALSVTGDGIESLKPLPTGMAKK